MGYDLARRISILYRSLSGGTKRIFISQMAKNAPFCASKSVNGKPALVPEPGGRQHGARQTEDIPT
jgi:hypothetical protein